MPAGRPEPGRILPIKLLEPGVQHPLQIWNTVTDQCNDSTLFTNPSALLIKTGEIKPMGGLCGDDKVGRAIRGGHGLS